MKLNLSRIAQEMERLEINDSELARRVGRSRAWPGQMRVTGQTTMKTLTKLADALGVPEHLLVIGGDK